MVGAAAVGIGVGVMQILKKNVIIYMQRPRRPLRTFITKLSPS
jgi:hypothetical protein